MRPTNADLVLWRIYAALGGDELTDVIVTMDVITSPTTNLG